MLAKLKTESARPRRLHGQASALALRHVFDVFRHAHPRVHAFFVDRERWPGKGWLCECSYGDGDVLFAPFACVVNCGTAGRAEVERSPAPSSPTRTNCFDDPVMTTEVAWNRAWAPKTLPVRRWQARQWQTETRMGSVEVTAESWPHEQEAVRIGIGGLGCKSVRLLTRNRYKITGALHSSH